MKLAMKWIHFFKEQNPLIHQMIMRTYFIFPLLLLVLALLEGLPLYSLDRKNILFSVLLGEAIVFVSHASSAGVLYYYNKGEADSGVTLTVYGSVILLYLIAITP